MLYYFVCVSFQDEEIDPLDAFMVQVDQQVHYRGLKFEVNWSACGGAGALQKSQVYPNSNQLMSTNSRQLANSNIKCSEFCCKRSSI